MQKWEYCILEMLKFSPASAYNNENEEMISALRLKFTSLQGEVRTKILHTVTVENLHQQEKIDHLAKSMGLLGGAGWEFVSTAEFQDRIDVCTVFSAYFKRPVLEGRKVEEEGFFS